MKAALMHFINNFGQHDDTNVNARYRYHIQIIGLLLALFVFNRIALSLVGNPENLKAHYVQTYSNGVPIGQEDLLKEKEPAVVKAYFAKVMRKTFNLDSYEPYKSYRNTINRANVEHFQLTWDSLNLTEAEFDTGVISDGVESYNLVGQELVAVLFKAGILKMLQQDQVKFWLEADMNNVVIKNSEPVSRRTPPCDSADCERQAMTWNVELEAKLFMVKVHEKSSGKFLPIKIYGRMIATSKMLSHDGLMVERMAAKIGDKK
jgi:hypothetical protein